MLLSGCGVGNFIAAPTETGNLTGNWQIQSGTSISSSPTGPVFIAGALQQQGSGVTGVFTVDSFCTTQPVFNFTGTVNSSGNLTLTATPVPVVKVTLAIPADPTTVATGNLGATGEICALALESPAVGVQIASLTGTFSGAVTASGSPAPPIASGQVSLTLAQSSTPNTNGQFPVTGSLTFTGGGCTSSASVTGIVSGEGITLAAVPGPGQSAVGFTGATNPTASQVVSGGIVFSPSPCSTSASSSTTFAGTLSRQ